MRKWATLLSAEHGAAVIRDGRWRHLWYEDPFLW